jgi:threonine/homoserine/homoserine lactone efflux protein
VLASGIVLGIVNSFLCLFWSRALYLFLHTRLSYTSRVAVVVVVVVAAVVAAVVNIISFVFYAWHSSSS